MNYTEIIDNIQDFVSDISRDTFIYDLLNAYGTPKATITRLRSGNLNQVKNEGEVLCKKKVWFKTVENDLLETIHQMQESKYNKSLAPRFLIVTDYTSILAIDTKDNDTLDCTIDDLPSNVDFFLHWAGMEKTKLSNENPADIKAAEKMAKLFDAIKKDNPEFVRDNPHAMNVFLSRLLFCFFAEDTGIFEENSVCNSIASHSQLDGADLHEFFERLFEVLDCEDRNKIPAHLATFPYVNGGLFKDHYPVPEFSARVRRMIIESGTLNWSEINPDIFGSMFQAVIDPEERHNLGQHYTSVTNIMKVIEPLFLNDFKKEFAKASKKNTGKRQALQRLLDRIWNVKIFDPACGSGNFLIIAYKELRLLEMEVFKELQTIEPTLPLSEMSVSQFYGIEIADFACETAILALWLAEHQMNLESKKVLGQAPVSLPLREGANIVCANACRIDWEVVCPKNDEKEIYILGNPPYLGSSVQTDDQKNDMAFVFNDIENYKNLDYIASWFFKGAEYIKNANSQYAFVSTNSICQGEQVAMLWPHIFKKKLEIGFAHQAFKWTNNAKGSAGVTCIVVNTRNIQKREKIIFKSNVSSIANNINAYLRDGSEMIISKRSKPISKIPPMSYGSKATCGSSLILTKDEKDLLITKDNRSNRFIRYIMGTEEFLKGGKRWCLWIDSSNQALAVQIPAIANRIETVQKERLKSKKAATKELAKIPFAFGEIRYKPSDFIIIPTTTSERRNYIPMGFLTKDTIITNSAHVVYDAKPFVFGILSSKTHMIWIKAVAGGLETRIRYSSQLCYNTFPIPKLTEDQKQTITMHVMNVLEEREKHPEKTMAQLYDPDKMPDDLREAHHLLDLAVDRCYRSKSFESDEERLEHLFKLYEEMIEQEEVG